MIPKQVTYINGGKLGDFINLLWVAYRKYELLGQKATMYITNNMALGGDVFPSTVDRAFHELIPILKQQHFIETFQNFDVLPANVQTKILGDSYVNLNAWRQHVQLQLEWLKLMSYTYQIPLAPRTKGWLSWSQRNPKYADKVVIHRSMIRHNSPTFPWDAIINHNKCVFITCNPKEAESFPWRDRVEIALQHTLCDMFTAIASAKFYIGNQSSPLTIATSLGKPCLVEMDVIWGHTYSNTEMCNGEAFWWYSPESNYMSGIEKYLALQ